MGGAQTTCRQGCRRRPSRRSSFLILGTLLPSQRGAPSRDVGFLVFLQICEKLSASQGHSVVLPPNSVVSYRVVEQVPIDTTSTVVGTQLVGSSELSSIIIRAASSVSSEELQSRTKSAPRCEPISTSCCLKLCTQIPSIHLATTKESFFQDG